MGRGRHLIARDCDLSDPEYRLWDFLGSCAVWDSRKEIFGFALATQFDLAGVLKWDASKVSRVMKRLCAKGLVEIYGRNLYRPNFIPDLQLAESGEKDAILHGEDVQRNFEHAIQNKNVANLHENQPQNMGTSLGSYKVGEGLFGEEDERWIQQYVK